VPLTNVGGQKADKALLAPAEELYKRFAPR
jgi:hypothetical protein